MTIRLLLTALLKLTAVAAALTVSTANGGHGHATEPAASEAPTTEDSPTGIRGVSLGDFRIRAYHQVDALKSTIRFSLFATVKGERFHESQELAEVHREKIRDQVIMAARLAPLGLFQEPDLATFRRRVLVRLRRALPELAIDDLYLSEFDISIKSL